MPKTNRQVLIESVISVLTELSDSNLASAAVEIIESCHVCPFKTDCPFFPVFTEPDDDVSDKLFMELHEKYPRFKCADYFYSKIKES